MFKNQKGEYQLRKSASSSTCSSARETAASVSDPQFIRTFVRCKLTGFGKTYGRSGGRGNGRTRLGKRRRRQEVSGFAGGFPPFTRPWRLIAALTRRVMVQE